jgi:poly(hydroxyalkanoate) granule-associated protein
MVKKLQKMASKKSAPAAAFNPASLLDGQIAANVRDSAQQIWAAGLASFSKAQGEGGKVFETLVKEGMGLQKKTQNLAEQKFGAVANKMTGMAGDVGAKAGQQWDKLESIFEERVSRALKSLGVPSGTDISSLISRIDALSAKIGFAPAKKAAPAAKTQPATKVKKVVAKAEKAVAPAKKAAVKQAVAVKKAVEAKEPAAPAKKAVKTATKTAAKAAPAPVAPTKTVAKRASGTAPTATKTAAKTATKAASTKAVATKAVEAVAKDVVQA